MADTVSVGSVLIPAMKDEGYDADFSAAVTASSSMIGAIIPPSVGMVIYGSTLGVSIGALFAAGIIPGLLIGFSLMVVSYVISVRRKYPVHSERFILSPVSEAAQEIRTASHVAGDYHRGDHFWCVHGN